MPEGRRARSRTVNEYLAALPPGSRAALVRLRRIIKAAAPDAEEVVSYGMPAFRQHGMLVFYAAFADHCSFFVGSPTARRRFAKELGPFAAGKGTVRFTTEKPLPAKLVTRIVRARVAENKARHARTSAPDRARRRRD